MASTELTLERVRAARERIAGLVAPTPCRESVHLSELCGFSVYLKLESLHPTGSFKERGAANRLALLSPDERARGVVAASAGNHAQAVARHARLRGVEATVVMPETTPLIKAAAARHLGARVVLHGKGYDDAARHADQLAADGGLTLVHPFDDLEVMAGQGTIALELIEQVPDLKAVVVPIGGGGLIAGVGCALRESGAGVQVYGVESRTFPGMKRRLEHTAPPEILGGKSIADGIAVRGVGALTSAVVERVVDGIELVDEEEIAEAMLHLLERDKTVAEGAGAVGVAALLHRRLPLQAGPVVVVVSGGNLDVNLLSRVIERGLVKTGRLARFQLVLPDVAGALASVAALVAELRANVLEINHDRAFAGIELGETLVELVVETRGPDHLAEVRERLLRDGYRLQALDRRSLLPG
jgi:threonine dehydratase